MVFILVPWHLYWCNGIRLVPWYLFWCNGIDIGPTALWRRHAKTVRDSSSSHKIVYVLLINNFINIKGHQNPIIGSKVTVILLKGWILPIFGVASGAVCACSLGSRLLY